MTKLVRNPLNGMPFVCVLSAILLAIDTNPTSAQLCCNDNIGTSVVVSAPATLPVAQTHTVSFPTTGTGPSTFRIENETVFRNEEQTRVRQVWEDEIRERRYTALRQVPETTIKQEIYRVLRPVWTTEFRDTSYDVIRTVPETSVREERYTVSRPVWETAEREVWQTVRRPVQETFLQERRHTVNRPVTSFRPEIVDRGEFVNVTTVEPGRTHNRLTWQRGGTFLDAATGAERRQLPGLYWTPMRTDPTFRQERVYQPNLVEQLTPVTTLVPETVIEQIPTTRTTFQEEQVLRREPYQVMRMVQEERVRQIPETRFRQVVERVQQTTPVQVQRIETQEVTRDIPVTSFRTVAEERSEQYTVRVPRVERIVETVQRPHIVQRRIPLDEFGNPTTIFPDSVTTPQTKSPEMGTYLGGTNGTNNGINNGATGGNGTYGGQPTNANGNGSSNGSGSANDPAATQPSLPPKDNGLGLGS